MRRNRLLSGLKAWAPLAQPNGLGCNRSKPSFEPHRGAITDLADKPDAGILIRHRIYGGKYLLVTYVR
jgi:hypothetical protein